VTLPAHRFRDREDRAKGDKTNEPKVWVCDLDETITTAPKLIAYLSKALKAQGDKFYVLTGNDSPRDELLDRLKGYDIAFDDLIQYHDSQSDGIARAHYLNQLNAYAAIDNRIDRAGTYVQACPHLFVMAEPPKVAEENAHGSKKAAKKAAKKVNRMEVRGEPRIPPGYDADAGTPETHCGNCDMFNAGACWGFGNVRVDGDTGKCRDWTPDGYDAAQDAADDTPTP